MRSPFDKGVYVTYSHIRNNRRSDMTFKASPSPVTTKVWFIIFIAAVIAVCGTAFLVGRAFLFAAT